MAVSLLDRAGTARIGSLQAHCGSACMVER